MLKSIDPLLNAELLHVLRAMGHGDDLALVDCNFPATSVAGDRPLIRLDGVDIPRAEKRSLVSFLSTVLSSIRYGEWRWSGVRPMKGHRYNRIFKKS